MKKASKDIFFLIKSLTPSEKRYFRQFASRHTIGEKNQYLDLFDAMDALSEYDENKLKARLTETSYLAYFPVAKQYLYQQILESLHHFHQNQQVEEKIKKQLHLCKILIHKKLLQQAEQLLKKTRTLLMENALWELAPELIYAERRLLRNKKGYNRTALETTYQAMQEICLFITNNNDYWFGSHQIMAMHLEKVKVSDATQTQKLDAIAAALLEKGLPADDLPKIDYYKALATYYFMNGNVPEAAVYNRNLLELFDKQTHLIEKEPEQYIAVFNNYLIDSHILGNYEDLEAGVEKLRKIPSQKGFNAIPNLDVKVLELTYSLQLNARIAQNQFESALEILPDLEVAIKKHQSKIAVNYLLTFYYLMAYIYFINRKFDRCLDYLDLMKNPQYKNVMTELQLAADRLLLMVHYELGNYLLLDSLLATTRRLHRQLKVESAVEKVLFKYLKKLASAANHQKRKALFTKMKSELLASKASDSRAWNYFDFEKWGIDGE